MTVYFIGAGPGDPDLITVKGQRLIRHCAVIIYAGSLVPTAVLEGHCAEQVINSAELHLEQIIELIRSAHLKGQDVARVHSGDPSLYGAIGEQIRCLRELGIPFEIVPGVTATSACAALLGAELTLPDISQSLILTRYADKARCPLGKNWAAWRSTGRPWRFTWGSIIWKNRRRTATPLWRRLPDCGDPPSDVAGSGLGDGDAGRYRSKSTRQGLSPHGADSGGTCAGQ